MSMTAREARTLLGVHETADADDVRRAYRRLARTMHPDAGGDAASFQRLQEAVAALLATPTPRSTVPPPSPSTSRTFRPSTDGRVSGAGWGERARATWHEGTVDVDDVDWDVAAPDPPHPWSRDGVARAAATDRDDLVVEPVTGQSRRPGSWLNRFGHVLASDLVATWHIAPARRRGHAGHDVEVTVRLPPGKARRVAHAADLPAAWTSYRRPNHTLLSLVLPPSRDPRATAVRAADHLVDVLESMGWPLEQWYAPVPPAS